MIRLGILISLALTLSSQSNSHEVRPAHLTINSTDISQFYTAFFRQPQIAGQFLGLYLDTNCEQKSVTIEVNNSSVTENYELACSKSGLSEIEIVGLERTMIDTLVSITDLNQSSTLPETVLITGDQPRIELKSTSYSLPVYLLIGFEHLLYGFDHILFVLMLMYLVKRPLDIVKIITIFTFAHSTTLALSVFEFIKVSQAPVEAIIAGTIVLLASENLSPSRVSSVRYLSLIVFSFGLLHGLGFAGALKEIGLPPSNQFNALLLFNLGLEAAQLAIVFLTLLAFRITKLKENRILFYSPVYLSGVIASYWFADRTWRIIAPLWLNSSGVS